MLRNLFLKSLRDQRRGLIGWSVGIAVLIAMTTAIWPSLKSMKDFDKLVSQYPDAMKELFDIEAMATGSGYLNAELFTLTIPVVFIIFAIARGSRLTASEEEQGTFEVLLTLPYSRTRILIQKAAALVVSTIVLGVVLFLTTALANLLLDMGVPVAELASASVAMVLLGIEFGLVTIALGALTGKRGTTLAGAGALAVTTYLFYVLGAFVDDLEPWRVISPFFQAVDAGPVGGGLQPAFLWMPLVGALAVAAALTMFNRRDISV